MFDILLFLFAPIAFCVVLSNRILSILKLYFGWFFPKKFCINSVGFCVFSLLIYFSGESLVVKVKVRIQVCSQLPFNIVAQHLENRYFLVVITKHSAFLVSGIVKPNLLSNLNSLAQRFACLKFVSCQQLIQFTLQQFWVSGWTSAFPVILCSASW